MINVSEFPFFNLRESELAQGSWGKIPSKSRGIVLCSPSLLCALLLPFGYGEWYCYTQGCQILLHRRSEMPWAVFSSYEVDPLQKVWRVVTDPTGVPVAVDSTWFVPSVEMPQLQSKWQESP